MIWVEPCAGSLAVGLRLMGCRSLVGYMGGKSGYAEAILNAFGLKPGDGCDEIWCADTGGWRYCWEALAKPGAALEAADIIDGWERQYGQGRPGGAESLWFTLRDEWRASPADASPAGAARWLVLIRGSTMNRGPCGGAVRHQNGGGGKWRINSAATRMRCLRLPPIRVWPDARAIPVTRDACVMIDPPYEATTGYGGGGLPRAEVRTIAEAWRSAGARVGICEHERMAWPGWSAVDITDPMRGSLMSNTGRARNRSEWLTLSEPAPVRPATQLPLWSHA